MTILKKSAASILISLLLALAYNLYFIFLLKDIHISYLLYLNLLLGVSIMLFCWLHWIKANRRELKKMDLLHCKHLIFQEFEGEENIEIAEHDVRILQQQLQEQIDLHHDLQDYIAKWCHEIKLPLAASFLIHEKITDVKYKSDMKEQLEKINLQLHTVLLGCKVQSHLYDFQIKPIHLLECVQTSIKNNQFFLIQKHFEMQLHVEDLIVYSDQEWLIYVLDQLFSNAIKYARAHPKISIWTVVKENEYQLFIKDNGEGIQEWDQRRIFEKGFTGSNHHNGMYKSTGMGLYMVSLIMKKLRHDIKVESCYGTYTCFQLTFHDNREFFHF